MTETQRPAFEPWTPVQVERKLDELINEIARAERAMRKLTEAEADAEWAYERAATVAAFDPSCPVPTRGGATVGERESFIKGLCDDELRGWIYHKKNVADQKRYIERLNQTCSLVQTMSKHVLAAYNNAGTRGEGWR